MKTNRLQILCILAGGSSALAAASSAADAPAPANNTAAIPTPANPFGPKPAHPVESPAAPQSAGLDTTPLPPQKFVETVHQLLLERFDKNKDGKLDAAELSEAEVLFSADRGRRAGLNGVVPAGPLYGLRPQILRNFGKANNDTLSAAEIAQLRTFLFNAPADSTKPDSAGDSLRQDILRQFDKNGDGQLSATELAAAKAQVELILAGLAKNTAEDSKHAAPPPPKTPAK
jgi:hypothetical protein